MTQTNCHNCGAPITLGPGELFVDGKPLGTVLAEDIFLEDEETPSFIKSINPLFSANQELSFTCDVDSRMLEVMCGVDLVQTDSFTVVCSVPCTTQIRKHRKKRINKKWAKRYGYRTHFEKIEFENVQFKETDLPIDGAFSVDLEGVLKRYNVF